MAQVSRKWFLNLLCRDVAVWCGVAGGVRRGSGAGADDLGELDFGSIDQHRTTSRGVGIGLSRRGMSRDAVQRHPGRRLDDRVVPGHARPAAPGGSVLGPCWRRPARRGLPAACRRTLNEFNSLGRGCVRRQGLTPVLMRQKRTFSYNSGLGSARIPTTLDAKAHPPYNTFRRFSHAGHPASVMADSGGGFARISPLSCQLTRITRDKGALAQDDRLDALAIGVAHFAASMAADVDKAVQRARDWLREQELRRFAQHVLRHGSPDLTTRLPSHPRHGRGGGTSIPCSPRASSSWDW